MLNNVEIENIKEKELTILTGSILSGKTTAIIDILKVAIKNNIPTLFFSLELSKNEVMEQLSITQRQLKNLHIINRHYIEDIVNITKKSNVKQVLIDSLLDIKTKENYCLGRGDILSIIIKKLKELAEEENIKIIVTATSKYNESIEKRISYFCKYKKAKDYIDRVICIDKESNKKC